MSSAEFSERLRVGCFTIPDTLVAEDIGLAQTLYSEVVPLRVEHLAWPGEYAVTAISRHFDEIGIGAAFPEYRVLVDGGKVRFERR